MSSRRLALRADLASYMLDTPTADDIAGINALY